MKNKTIMEVCGGHTHIILSSGLKDSLPNDLKLISGPGCPVCVTPQIDIDAIIALSNKGIPIATYGDMLRVPGTNGSLEDAKAKGAKVFEIYSVEEIIELKKEYSNIIFFAIGFETTIPMTAKLLEWGIPIYSVHRRIIPAMKALENEVDGYIGPGHVSAIIGSDEYEQLNTKTAIAGFSAGHVLIAISALLKDSDKKVINCYPEAVTKEGNKLAKEMINKHFKIADSDWRGFGILKESGYEPKDKSLDAKEIYKEIIKKLPLPKQTPCRCEEVITGKITPEKCSLFNKTCTPENPTGPCMVSAEGACGIYFGAKK